MNSTLSRIAAAFAAAGFVAVAAIQVFWALGGSWGLSGAWGGGHASGLSAGLRAGSGVSCVLLVVSALVVLGRAGYWGGARPSRWYRGGIWAVVALMALTSLANLASPGHTERTLNGPGAVVVMLLCIIVATGKVAATTSTAEASS